MLATGRTGSVVTLLCDGGERYAHTYYNDGWLTDHGLDIAPHQATIARWLASSQP